jgi:cytochrome c biogenesis protein CcdA/glutaredoxin
MKNLKSKVSLVAIALILFSGIAFAGSNISNQSTDVNKNLLEKEPTIVFFYSPTCPHCDKVEEHIKSLNDTKFELKKYQASSNTEKFSAYIENHSIPTRYAGSVPTVFIGDESAVGSRNSINLIEEKLNPEEIEADKEDQEQEDTGKDKAKENKISEDEGVLSGIGLLGFLGLAVTDSINPCALAVLLILVGSIMSGNLRDQLKALKAGASFTVGIFISYFFMGVLLIFGIKSLREATAVGIDSIYLFFGGFAILIGLLNLKDWFSHGLGGFVIEVPYSWRPKMKSYLKKVTGPAGAFITAIIVSLFLLPCTSGPYFVAGGLLSNMAWTASIPLLLAYNMVFVAPMLFIIGTLYYGATEVEQIQEWRKENIEELHLIAGVILILLGIYLLISTGI